MALKLSAHGVSPSAFQDCFQMNETTGRGCLKTFALAISSSAELWSIYKRNIIRSDVHRISRMHLQEHGVKGVLSSLDYMQFVGWKNCSNLRKRNSSNCKNKIDSIMECAIQIHGDKEDNDPKQSAEIHRLWSANASETIVKWFFVPLNWPCHAIGQLF